MNNNLYVSKVVDNNIYYNIYSVYRVGLDKFSQ